MAEWNLIKFFMDVMPVEADQNRTNKFLIFDINVTDAERFLIFNVNITDASS
jgi:hypothetical protein